jgi:hypothetical protein
MLSAMGRLFTVIFCLALFGPIALLPLTWRRFLSHEHRRYPIAIAALTSLSYGYLLASLLFRHALLGGDYSGRLFGTVQVNTVLAFVLFIMAVVPTYRVRALLACSALTIGVAWFLVWVVNAAV